MPKKFNRPNPKKGEVFTKVYKNKEFRMEVIEHNGKIGYKVQNKIYPSPTGAAKSITKTDVNGWKFWNMI